jgi:hypothetical protein
MTTRPNTVGSVPAEDASAVTPSDSTSLTNAARALYIGTAGNVTLVTIGGSVITFSNVQSGTILPVRTTRVNATSTTATNIVALY